MFDEIEPEHNVHNGDISWPKQSIFSWKHGPTKGKVLWPASYHWYLFQPGSSPIPNTSTNHNSTERFTPRGEGLVIPLIGHSREIPQWWSSFFRCAVQLGPYFMSISLTPTFCRKNRFVSITNCSWDNWT